MSLEPPDDGFSEQELYVLGSNDRAIIEATKQLLWKIARSSLVDPLQLEVVAKLLAVLQRMPHVHTEIDVRMELAGPNRRYGDHEIFHWWEVGVEERLVEVYSKGFFNRDWGGGDSFLCMHWAAQPGFDTEFADHLDSLGIVDDAMPFEEEVNRIDLSEPGYRLTVYLEGEETKLEAYQEELDDEEDLDSGPSPSTPEPSDEHRKTPDPAHPGGGVVSEGPLELLSTSAGDVPILKVPRTDIEQLDITRLHSICLEMMHPDHARALRQRIWLRVDGYADDPREPLEIPEVRKWMQKFDERWPYSFFFLDPRISSNLHLIACSVCPFKLTSAVRFTTLPGLPPRLYRPTQLTDKQASSKFLEAHFVAMNAICEGLGDSEDVIRRMRELVLNSLGFQQTENGRAEPAMMFAPDYGLRLLADGHRPDTLLHFYPFMMFILGILSPGHYTTSSRTPIDGMDHSVSLDFDTTVLDAILDLCPSIKREVDEWLAIPPPSASTLELSRPVQFGLAAKLGTLQKGAYEEFVPLVAQSVFACGE